MNNTPEDLGSRSVADAAAYERWRQREAQDLTENYGPDRLDEVFAQWGQTTDEDPSIEDECMCSDPGCPCAGTKRGRL